MVLVQVVMEFVAHVSFHPRVDFFYGEKVMPLCMIESKLFSFFFS